MQVKTTMCHPVQKSSVLSMKASYAAAVWEPARMKGSPSRNGINLLSF